MTHKPAWRSLIGIVVLLALWVIAVDDDLGLSVPLSSVARTAVQQFASGELIEDVVASFVRVTAGILIGTALATLLASVTYFSPAVKDYLHWILECIRPVPPIAWTPVAIVLFGIGTKPAIAVVALGSFFPIWHGLLQGLSDIQRAHIHAARSLGATQLGALIWVAIPSVLPAFFLGLRLGVGIGWFCVVAAEMLGASDGLGYGVQLYSLNLEMSKLFVYLAAIGLCGFSINSVFRMMGNQLNAWRSAKYGI